jgi:hypothetical protein
VRQTDVAGNVSAAGSLTFTLDTLAPGRVDCDRECDGFLCKSPAALIASFVEAELRTAAAESGFPSPSL